MPTEVMTEEAYLIGCLLARGSIIAEANSYRLVLRLPFREYSPLGETLVRHFQKAKNGLLFKEITEIPQVQSYGLNKHVIVAELVKLKNWAPWRKTTEAGIIKQISGKWLINDSALANEYLDRQRVYLDRERESSKYLVEHLQKTASSIATDIKVQNPEQGQFGTKYMLISAKIPPIMFNNTFKKEYGLDIGDMYRQSGGIPKKVWDYQPEAAYEFVRGLADIAGFFDEAPAWGLISKEGKPLSMWQVRFSYVNENPLLARDTCLYLQNMLKIPVFCIDWADVEGASGVKTGRGLRDHLVEVWLNNLESIPGSLFYLPYKQQDFKQHLIENKTIMTKGKKNRRKIPCLAACPRGPKPKDYMLVCRFLDCSRLPKNARLDKILNG